MRRATGLRMNFGGGLIAAAAFCSRIGARARLSDRDP